MLELLDEIPHGLSVSIIVGENGSGKSTLLRSVAEQLRNHRDVYAISNTVYDKFSGMQGITRISANGGRNLPAKMLKDAIRSASEVGIVRLRTIANTLRYCGYSEQIGLRPRLGSMHAHLSNFASSLEQNSRKVREITDILEHHYLYQALDEQLAEELRALVEVLVSDARADIRWLDFFESDAYQSSKDQQYVRLVEWEKLLKEIGLITGFDIYIRRLDGVCIRLNAASSGQLSLIASFVFLAATIGKQSVVLIDEPENSLHPIWQKEYVERLLALLVYYEPTIIIATHAPIVVSGAQLNSSADVRVFGLSTGELSPIERQGSLGGSQSMEETLFQAFGTVTPANHFVSEVLANEFSKIRSGASSASTFAGLLKKMREGSFDEHQLQFFDDIERLAMQVEGEGKGIEADDE